MRSTTWAIVVVVVGSCSGKTTVHDDCKLVLEDPAQAMARVSERYPGDPVKVAETIERCVAPTGDECERFDKLVRAIPSMMGSARAFSTPPVEVCRTSMTPEMRRCMLPSYVLAHADECARVREKMAQTVIEQVPITPRVPDRDTTACNVPALALEPDRLTLTRGPSDKRISTRREGPLDATWLEERLREEKRALAECTFLDLSGARGVRYQDVIAAMDIAVKVGFIDVGLDDGDPPSPDSEPLAPDRRLGAKDALQNAPVLVITKAELTLGGKPIATVADVADGPDVIEALTKALSAPPADRMVILQADQSTDMIVITRAIRTLKRAGYNNVLFAVKNK